MSPRNREDTVRCIVSSLTEEGNNELSDELNRGEPLVLDESYCSDEDKENWETWMPDPVDADPGNVSWLWPLCVVVLACYTPHWSG